MDIDVTHPNKYTMSITFEPSVVRSAIQFVQARAQNATTRNTITEARAELAYLYMHSPDEMESELELSMEIVDVMLRIFDLQSSNTNELQ